MPNETFANNAPSNTVSAGYSAGTTSIVMNAVSGYPAVPQFRLLNQRNGEIVLVTGVVGTTLTVQRGVENSSAQAINSGDSFVHILTGGALVALVGPIQQSTVTAAATIVIANLNLSADLQYEIEFSGVWNGSFANATQCVLLPNGGIPSSVNGVTHRAYTSSQDMGATPLSTILLFQSDFSVGTGGLEIWFRCRMRWGPTGRKTFEIDNILTASATQVMWAKNVCVWHDTTTNILSITINPNAGTLTGTVKVKPVR